MIKTTLTVAGMVCGMCEAHVNDTVRSAFPVKKVSSSRSKGETIILSEQPLDLDKLRRLINTKGYTVLSAHEELQKRQSLLSAFLKKP